MKSFYNYQTIDFRGRRISYLIEKYDDCTFLYSTKCSLEDRFSRRQGRIELQKKKEKYDVDIIPYVDTNKIKNYIYSKGILAYPSKRKVKRQSLFSKILNYFKKYVI